MSDAAARVETAYQHRLRARRWTRLAGGAALLAALAASAQVSQAWPGAILAGLPRAGDYFAKLVPDLRWGALFAGSETEGSLAYWFYRLDSWAWLLFETSQMAALATLAAAVVALLLCFPAAATLAPNRAVYLLTRRGLEACRTVPELVYALILVWAFGVGPLAGILAIALHSTGSLGKLFAEAAENADPRPLEGVRAAGGSWAQGMRHAVLPQVLPNLLSYALLRFEINLRGASVIGFVGAGGIGQELYTTVSLGYYQEVGAILVLIVLCVSCVDLASERLRHAAIGHAR